MERQIERCKKGAIEKVQHTDTQALTHTGTYTRMSAQKKAT